MSAGPTRTDETRLAATAPRSLAALSLAGFVALGLPDGMWGTAWPTMRHTFHQRVGALGLLLVAVTAGALLTSLATARLIQRVGVGTVLTGAAVLGGVAAVLLVAASSWSMVVAAAFFVGTAAGILDTGLNVVVAMSGRVRLLNLLHGSYGVGTALGPVVVTVAVLVSSWRPAYGFLFAVEVVMAASWWSTRASWAGAPGSGPGAARPVEVAPEPSRIDGRQPAPRLVVAAGITTFFTYTGFEVSAGQWAATYLRGPAGLSAGAAGVVVFAYWACLTAVRFAVAAPRTTPPPVLLVRTGCAASVVGALLVWWGPSPGVTIGGLCLIGGALAPVYPALVTLTPRRVGLERAHRVIGWQVAAAGVGGAAISALAGLVLQHDGLRSFGPFLAASGGLMLAASVALEVLARAAGVTSAGRPSRRAAP